MTFEEIFDVDGLYIANGFGYGFAYRVHLGGLSYVQYSEPEDANPNEDRVKMYKDFLVRDYTKVDSVSDLFKG